MVLIDSLKTNSHGFFLSEKERFVYWLFDREDVIRRLKFLLD
jgi:hypothetical protein